MNNIERQQAIMKRLNSNGSVRISDLTSELGVSRETLRKDIAELGRQGKLQVIRGGAVLNKPVNETIYNQRLQQNLYEKQSIAQNAIKLISDGDSVFVGNGTTAALVAQAIKGKGFNNLVVITTSIHVLKALEDADPIQLVILGGGLRRIEGSLSGPLTLANIDGIFCDVGFFGSGGVSIELGVTNHYFSEIEVDKKMMRQCRTKVLLADHSKFTKMNPFRTASIEDYDVILSDQGLEKNTISAMIERNVKVII
ncbi:DeoR/GlpR family DNA-binding transcription regulator [Lacticaseibacillus rhamnosus]|uniref:DeoR/GlpR family DNA-binding transcription regulator n=1 Tax=Lacticaseibacillus rhamnosus TaxID=47715 RepID=UPI0007E264D7|nr:DeoR/GlpR family DNA-binding transcription regulator [Lacticaseibacillus rhamnosus]MBB1165480.1 DeoR/GlpR transcriptional regulator [Lacticaseibacillus rhamnosus]MCZ2731778.1 DeoR/GlpR family DNA-binding transcription regulator [Lacticaseibacillus rhamnosus]MCZ2734375.1 DeoR/GlpR family DNA-binding transcription regulator [Lacticaseibacillus rhamnosus]MCZ2740525.1 DeoR/GlpR family DNA-binding transcription regulator [Lacticaseibacillus rhamnosus]MCZ2743537.1 DeoR/GlpR family DNA-binding tra